MEKKQTSIDMKELIIKLWKEKKSVREISEIVKKPRSTVHYVIQVFKKNGFLQRPSGSDDPKKLRLLKQNEKLFD